MQFERYEKDLEALILTGRRLIVSMQHECHPDKTKRVYAEHFGGEKQADAFMESLPAFGDGYQPWYSESKALIRQLLPDRLDDFVRHYEKPRNRKDLSFESYVIEDYLQGTVRTRTDPLTRSKDVVVPKSSAIPRFQQQVNIVEAAKSRFRTSLFDLRQVAQADLFDSELDAAKELAKGKFGRAAGAVAGVVLERHLKDVCSSHSLTLRKKPVISNLNDILKDANVINVAQWRHILLLGDLRNLCVHDNAEPTDEQVSDLLLGVEKVIKTVF